MKRNNIDTSKEAYFSLEPEKIRAIYEKILWALSQIGEGSYEDIAIALRIDSAKIWKRLSEMSRLEMIYRTENKKMLSSGRMGYTWKATLKGSPTVQDRSRNIQSIYKQVQLKLL